MVVECASLGAIRWHSLTRLPALAGPVLVRLSVSENTSHVARLAAVLQADERARANRYYQQEDQCRFIMARAALRLLLGECLGQAPTDIQFGVGPHKKPRLLRGEVQYNVSHAKDWVVIALSNAEVGIDVEYIDPAFQFQAVLSHSFSSLERAFISNSAAARYLFYRSWTRKEALVKATGQGIDDDFQYLPSLDGCQYLETKLTGIAPQWLVNSFEVAPAYVAAVARATDEHAPEPQFYELGAAWLTSAIRNREQGG